VRKTRSLVIAIGVGGTRGGGGKDGGGSVSVGMFGVLGDGRGTGIGMSSAVTKKSCS